MMIKRISFRYGYPTPSQVNEINSLLKTGYTISKVELGGAFVITLTKAEEKKHE